MSDGYRISLTIPLCYAEYANHLLGIHGERGQRFRTDRRGGSVTQKHSNFPESALAALHWEDCPDTYLTVEDTLRDAGIPYNASHSGFGDSGVGWYRTGELKADGTWSMFTREYQNNEGLIEPSTLMPNFAALRNAPSVDEFNRMLNEWQQEVQAVIDVRTPLSPALYDITGMDPRIEAQWRAIQAPAPMTLLPDFQRQFDADTYRILAGWLLGRVAGQRPEARPTP